MLECQRFLRNQCRRQPVPHLRFKGVPRLPRCERSCYYSLAPARKGFFILNQAGGANGKMSSNLEMKKQVVADIVEKLKNAESMVICSYSGLTVEQVTALRKQCRENDVHYCVLKNRLVLRALQELNIEGLDSLLEGPNAFVFGDKDVTAAPKILSTFIDKNKLTSIEIKGGLMGTEVMDVAAVKELAATPSREELLATMVGCLVSPVSALVSVLEQIAEKKEAA